jgi:S1-C subfamily serine protease
MPRLLTRALLITCLLPAACAEAQKPPPLGGDYIPESLARPGPAPMPMPEAAPAPRSAPRDPASIAALPKPAPLPPGADSAPGGAMRRTSSGTGFVVAPGRVLTNAHVTEGCAQLQVRTAGGQMLPAAIGPRDRDKDLALLSVGGDIGPPLSFRGTELRRGEGVVTYGFPLAGLLGSGPTLTTGEIAALSGLRDNQAQYQISAPVQPGNSGGPLLDLSGQVVGVVTSKLNAQRIAQSTGDIPQNVNFAVKGEEAVAFLRANGIQPAIGRGSAARSAADVGDLAHPSTVFLRCLN